MSNAEISRSQKPGPLRRGMVRILVLVQLLALGALLVEGSPIGVVADGWAQAPVSGADQFLSGHIRAVGSKTIRIDSKEYPLDPKVTITDLVKKHRSLKDLKPGTPVWFHLTKGRIDRIILDEPS